jgi:hypothetical protein
MRIGYLVDNGFEDLAMSIVSIHLQQISKLLQQTPDVI